MELPFVLAGPVLRRVEPRGVAVWIALSRPATVSMLVWEGLRKSGTSVVPIARSDPVAALRVGERLFVALAVAERLSFRTKARIGAVLDALPRPLRKVVDPS